MDTGKGEPDHWVAIIRHVFLGVRVQCAKCHDHPFDRWSQNHYYRLARQAWFVQKQCHPDLEQARLQHGRLSWQAGETG